VLCLTENRNRTGGDMRHVFDRFGGHLGGAGSVAWKFDVRGVLTVDRAGVDEETLLGVALDAGALDVDTSDDEVYEVLTPMAALETVRRALVDHRVAVASAEISRLPQNTIALSPAEALKVLKLTDALEDHDDVQKVWSDLDIPEEVLAKLGG